MVSRVVAGILEAKHGWLQSYYVDFNVEASREPLRCQSLSLQSMVIPWLSYGAFDVGDHIKGFRRGKKRA